LFFSLLFVSGDPGLPGQPVHAHEVHGLAQVILKTTDRLLKISHPNLSHTMQKQIYANKGRYILQIEFGVRIGHKRLLMSKLTL